VGSARQEVGLDRKDDRTKPRETGQRLGPLIRDRRCASGLGLKRAAPHLGVTYTYLSKIENGLVTPSDELLQRMAAYYGDSDALFAAASRLPPDVQAILRENQQEAVQVLRKRFGGGGRKR